MVSEKAVGSIFVILGIGAIVYLSILGTIALYLYPNDALYKMTYLFNIIPIPPIIWIIWAIVAIAIFIVSLIFVWVGVSLIKTPSLEEIDVEELEKEVEKELAKQAGEQKSQESESKEGASSN